MATKSGSSRKSAKKGKLAVKKSTVKELSAHASANIRGGLMKPCPRTR